MNPKVFGDPFTFPIEPPTGQSFDLFTVVSRFFSLHLYANDTLLYLSNMKIKYSLKRYFILTHTQIILPAFISSALDYSNGLFTQLSQKSINQLLAAKNSGVGV